MEMKGDTAIVLKRILFSRTAIQWGLVFLTLHTLLVFRTAWFCYTHQGQGQVELAWILFWIIDFPSIFIFDWLRDSPLMVALFDWGYSLVGSGPNLSLAAYVGVIGGVQWYFIGSGFRAIIVTIANRLFKNRRRQHAAL